MDELQKQRLLAEVQAQNQSNQATQSVTNQALLNKKLDFLENRIDELSNHIAKIELILNKKAK